MGLAKKMLKMYHFFNNQSFEKISSRGGCLQLNNSPSDAEQRLFEAAIELRFDNGCASSFWKNERHLVHFYNTTSYEKNSPDPREQRILCSLFIPVMP